MSLRVKRSNPSSSYQVVIIGGGPAGLTAGLYCARSKFNGLLIEQGIIGGQITNAERVENYPGFPKGISGIGLGQLIHEQAISYGLETLLAEVTKVVPVQKHNLVSTSEGDFIAESVIIASGSQFRKLGVPGEDKFVGKGISYCATCDGPLFRAKTVAVIGGGECGHRGSLPEQIRFLSQGHPPSQPASSQQDIPGKSRGRIQDRVHLGYCSIPD
jgi:thioredoxin reductase (NADPH)